MTSINDKTITLEDYMKGIDFFRESGFEKLADRLMQTEIFFVTEDDFGQMQMLM